jgi:hypothetical protein
MVIVSFPPNNPKKKAFHYEFHLLDLLRHTYAKSSYTLHNGILFVFACLHTAAACIFVYVQAYNSIQNSILLKYGITINKGAKFCPSRDITHQFTFNSCITNIQDSIQVNTKAEESTRETEGKLGGRNKEGHEREEPALRPVGR